ncbi:MAG TPA: hypothetical protein VGI33_04590 [Paenibacillus sp.]
MEKETYLTVREYSSDLVQRRNTNLTVLMVGIRQIHRWGQLTHWLLILRG